MSNIGIMDGAYFVGKKKILDWINDTLQLNIAKVEQTAFGGIAVQFLDIMYPGQVPMHKVNWSAKGSHEFVGNYKILQNTFDKLKIEKHVDVDKLIKGLYMDNLEFMQWMKRFFEMSIEDIGDYNPIERRAKGKGGVAYNNTYANKNGNSSSSSSSSRTTTTTNTTRKATNNITTHGQKENSANVPPTKKRNLPLNKKVMDTSSSANTNTTAASNVDISKYTTEIATLNKNNIELKQEMDGLEKERDFYFDKLRDIEMMLQDMDENGQSNELSKSIFKILYATAEGFEPAEDETDTHVDKKTTETANTGETESSVQVATDKETFIVGMATVDENEGPSLVAEPIVEGAC